MRVRYDRRSGCYRASLPWQGDPYAIIPQLREHFGSLFFYRIPGRLGQRRYLYASLAQAQVVRAPGAQGRNVLSPRRVRAALDKLAGPVLRGEGQSAFGAPVVFAFAYDLAATFRTGARAADLVRGDEPLGYLAAVDHALVYDEQRRTLEMQAPEREQVEALVELGRATPAASPDDLAGRRRGALASVVRDIDAAQLARQLSRARVRFERGDVYQVVLSSHLHVQPNATPEEYFRTSSHWYRAATFSYYVSHEQTKFFGNCSLPHVMCADGSVRTRVFAGTNEAARTVAAKERIHAKLLHGRKYFAEHVMLVDVERNDMSAFCEPGSVRVSRFMRPIQVGPTTYLASDVVGRASPDCTLSQLVLTSFPRSVVTGAPKQMAQEIIAELEGQPRSFYAGAIGVFDRASGSLVSNTIVTCAHQRGAQLVLQVGGGMTAESTPTQELAEMQMKVRYLV